MAQWPNHFISGKQFQKRPNLAYLAFKKAKWQPWAKRCNQMIHEHKLFSKSLK